MHYNHTYNPDYESPSDQIENSEGEVSIIQLLNNSNESSQNPTGVKQNLGRTYGGNR